MIDDGIVLARPSIQFLQKVSLFGKFTQDGHNRVFLFTILFKLFLSVLSDFDRSAAQIEIVSKEGKKFITPSAKEFSTIFATFIIEFRRKMPPHGMFKHMIFGL